MEQPVSFLLQVRQGYHPDLGTVARACLAFEDAARDAAQHLGLPPEVRLEIARATEGSLNVHNIFRSAKTLLTDKIVLTTLAANLLLFFVKETGAYLTHQMIEEIIRTEEPRLSQDEVDQIADTLLVLLRKGAGDDGIRRFYSEIEKDEKIEGVGVTLKPAERPRVIVPRSEFNLRAASPIVEGDTESIRTTVTRERVVLVSPVLLPGNRRWRFRWGAGEFGAPIRDEQFLQRVLSGAEPIQMRGGITMEVVLETKEERADGLWRPAERSILEVLDVQPEPQQGSLFHSPSSEEQD